jgi:DNA-binding response OmpR family regulator
MKILLIEDEAGLAENIIDYLSGENYHCELAETYQSAVEKIHAYSYDCILLDLMLPGGNGLQILELLKQQNKQDGVIIISAKNSIEDKVNGLQAGADDYLAKPFHLSELAARLHSVIRRKHFSNSNIVEQSNLKINLQARELSINNQPVVLTRKEFDLLLFFISNKNKVISKSAVAEHLSGDIADMLDSHDFVYAHIKNLKRKLTDAGADNYIKTIYGTGYKWEA